MGYRVIGVFLVLALAAACFFPRYVAHRRSSDPAYVYNEAELLYTHAQASTPWNVDDLKHAKQLCEKARDQLVSDRESGSVDERLDQDVSQLLVACRRALNGVE